MSQAGQSWRFRSAIALLVAIWGTTFAAIRIGLEDLPPFTGMAVRFSIASAVLLVFAYRRGVDLRPSREHLLFWLANGLLTFAIPYSLTYWAEQWIPSGLTAVLFSIFPLFVAVLAHFSLPEERLRASALLGLVVGLGGVALIYSDDLDALSGAGTYRAALLFLVAPFAAALGQILVKRSGQQLDALSVTAPPMLFTALWAWVFAFFWEREAVVAWTPSAIAVTCYLALIGSALAFVLYFRLLQQVRAVDLSLITYAIPVVAVAVGSQLLGEKLSLSILVGCAAVVVGVALTLRSGAKT